jgi:hypothetical protein
MIRRAFDENGDYAINEFIVDADATVQAVETRLKLFKGEWFLNLSSGVPWYQRVFIKPAKTTEVESAIRETIIQTEGVKELLQFDLVFDSQTRKASVSFSANTIYGDDISLTTLTI